MVILYLSITTNEAQWTVVILVTDSFFFVPWYTFLVGEVFPFPVYRYVVLVVFRTEPSCPCLIYSSFQFILFRFFSFSFCCCCRLTMVLHVHHFCFFLCVECLFFNLWDVVSLRQWCRAELFFTRDFGSESGGTLPSPAGAFSFLIIHDQMGSLLFIVGAGRAVRLNFR